MTEYDEEKPIFNIVGEHVALGPMARDHLNRAVRWINDFGTIRTMGQPPRPMTHDAEVEWYENVRKSDTDVVFAIYDRQSNHLIGSAGLHQINWRHRTAEFGIMIGEPDYRGRGFGTESTHLMLDYAFRHLGLLNVMLRVVAINEAGIRAYRAAGFTEFGRWRNAWFIEGERYDIVFMDCMPEDVGAG